MYIAVSTQGNGKFCEDFIASGGSGGPIADFCSTNRFLSYMRVYSIVVGDFEVSDFQEPDFLLYLFFVVTIIGVLILLNVLIAVISDSYERAQISSRLLFGRARVNFVAQNQALEGFLQPGSNPVDDILEIKSAGKAISAFGGVLRWLVLISLFATAMNAEVFLVSQAIEAIENRARTSVLEVLFLSVVLLILTSGLWVLFFFAIGNIVLSYSPKQIKGAVALLDRCNSRFVKFIANGLFGLGRAAKNLGKDDWVSRIVYMEKAFITELANTKDELKAEMLKLECRIYEHDDLMFNVIEEEDEWESQLNP
jgi:hypothetical protein